MPGRVGFVKRQLVSGLALALGLSGGAAWLVTASTPSGAVTVFNVTSTADSGANSLRDAFTAAAASGGEIDVQAGLGTITLSTGAIKPATWGGAVTLKGNGVTINGGGSTSGVIVRQVGSTGDLSIDGVTITNSAPTGADGLAAVVAVGQGALSLSNCVISHNHTTVEGTGAGAVYSDTTDPTTISGCVIGPDNTAHGVAIAGGVTSEGGRSGVGTVTVTNSAIVGNVGTNGAKGDVAGGIFNNGKSVTVVNSSVTGNSATGGRVVGGAIDNEGGPATTTNSTISGNSATLAPGVPPINLPATNGTAGSRSPGRHADASTVSEAVTVFVSGGIANLGGSETLTYVTLNNNTDNAHGVSTFAAAQYLNAGGTVAFFATAIGDPVGGTSCVLYPKSPGFVSTGYNAEDDAAASCGFSASTHDVVGENLKLGSLADNGGPGPTQLPQTGSLLIDGVPTSSCQASTATGITTDERGITRPQGPGCDIGAAEVKVSSPPPVAAAPAPVETAPAFTG
jgi:hypothetical protein